MSQPDLNRIPAYYHNYVNLVRQAELPLAFDRHLVDFKDLLNTIPIARWEHSYAPGKWTVKELVQHVIDAERVFAYRALAFARQDPTPLPGFDENSYAANSKAARRTKADLLRELEVVQRSSVLLFESFDEGQLQSSGIANGKPVYVQGLGFVIIGHTLHHLNILKERYL